MSSPVTKEDTRRRIERRRCVSPLRCSFTAGWMREEPRGSAHMTVVLPQVPCCGSCGIIQHPLPEKIQLHPAISTALDQLQAIDVAFDRPVRPGERQGRGIEA